MTDFTGQDILSTRQLGLVQIEKIMEMAEKFWPIVHNKEQLNVLKGKVLAALFYEPSTRTRLSFETAMHRLGGNVITVSGMESSSLAKGETLWDTAKVIENFADVIAVRHPEPGSAAEIARSSSIPVLNGGDGAGEHPSQALLDVFTMRKELSDIQGTTIGLVGDLKFGRTVHSLSYVLAHFGVKLILISPDQLKMPKEITDDLRKAKIEFRETEDMNEGLKHAQVLYMTRIQKERFIDSAEYEKFKGYYVLTREQIEKHNGKMVVMHPLPRVGEISLDVDDLSGAAYFRQVQNGVALRMALLALVLGKA